MRNIGKIAIAAMVLLTACKKDKENVVTIKFEKPTVGEQITTGDELHIEGTIEGTAEMHGYTVSAVKTSTNEVLFSESYDSHAKAYNFHEHWVNNVAETTEITVKVEAEKDKNGTKETKTVNVTALP